MFTFIHTIIKVYFGIINSFLNDNIQYYIDHIMKKVKCELVYQSLYAIPNELRNEFQIKLTNKLLYVVLNKIRYKILYELPFKELYQTLYQ